MGLLTRHWRTALELDVGANVKFNGCSFFFILIVLRLLPLPSRGPTDILTLQNYFTSFNHRPLLQAFVVVRLCGLLIPLVVSTLILSVNLVHGILVILGVVQEVLILPAVILSQIGVVSLQRIREYAWDYFIAHQ